MRLRDWLFRRKTKQEVPSMPSWESIVDRMYDKQLSTFDDEIIQVIYSKDRAKRFLILKDEKGLFKYYLEELYALDEDEWNYFCLQEDVLPGSWQVSWESSGRSLFGTPEQLLKEMKAEPVYKRYFE